MLVDNVPGQWYDIHIAFNGNLMTVSRGVYGGTMTALFTDVDILAFPGYTDVAFGKGNNADYQFDDVRFVAGSIDELSAQRRYEYDALGRRVLQTVFVGGVPVNTWFVYDGDRVIEEYREDGGSLKLLARYVYGQYIDEVLQRELDLNLDGGALEEVHYYLHDDLYNVVGITDDAGTLVERYEYGDYGKPTIYQVPAAGPEVVVTASAIANPYMFNGRRYDAHTGLYYYRTRYMDPVQGRFIARDTIGVWGDANNLGNPFSYLDNNPWSGLDPFGEGPIWDGWSEGVRNGSVVVYDHITFHKTNMHYLAVEIQADAATNGDVLSQIGFGAGKAGGEAGYMALGVGVLSKIRFIKPVAAFLGRHSTAVMRVNQGLAVGMSANAGWNIGGSIDAASQGDYNTATHKAGRGLLSGIFAGSAANGAQRLATRVRVEGNVAVSANATGKSNFPVRIIQTPHGAAVQDGSRAAEFLAGRAGAGIPLYRVGRIGKQHTGNAQFWSVDNPAATAGYADSMGLPAKTEGLKWFIRGRVMPSANFIARPAPGIGTNVGGGLEIVTDANSVTIDSFHMPN